MRKVTICKLKEIRKPGKRDDWFEHHVYTMQPGTAWKWDVYGQHTVVEVDESITKKSEGWCLMHFDGRSMICFKLGNGEEYLQPLEEDARATDDRLGKKRKIRKLKKPRRDAPGVAPQAAGSWENDGPAPVDDSDHPPSRRARKVTAPPGEPRPYRRAGSRGGLRLE